MTLRSKLIKLANDKPELRKHILPLITKSAKAEASFTATQTVKIPTFSSGKLTVETCKKGETEGGTVEFESADITIIKTIENTRYIVLDKKSFKKQ